MTPPKLENSSEIQRAAEALQDVSKPVFGEWFTGIYASDDNPKKHGRYVRTIRRPKGRMNPGTFYELTDGHGYFWQYPVDCIVRRAAGDPEFEAFCGGWEAVDDTVDLVDRARARISYEEWKRR